MLQRRTPVPYRRRLRLRSRHEVVPLLVELVVRVHALNTSVLLMHLLLSVMVLGRRADHVEGGILIWLLNRRFIEIVLHDIFEGRVVVAKHLHQLIPVAALNEKIDAGFELLILKLKLPKRFFPRRASF